MCFWCGFQVQQSGKTRFEFPLALPVKKADPIVERLESVESVLNQLVGDDVL